MAKRPIVMELLLLIALFNPKRKTNRVKRENSFNNSKKLAYFDKNRNFVRYIC